MLCGGGHLCTTSSKGWLFTIGPDMDEFLAVIALCKNCLSSVSLNLDDDMAEAGQFKYV